MRIALCGYAGEHDMPASWPVFEWSTQGGYGNNGEVQTGNKRRERIWFSPACINDDSGQIGLF